MQFADAAERAALKAWASACVAVRNEREEPHATLPYMRHRAGIAALALPFLVTSSAFASDVPVLCTLNRQSGKWVLALRNMGNRPVAVTKFRWAYVLTGWDRSGKLITDEGAFKATADLAAIRPEDWLVLKPRATFKFPVEFWSSSGVVSARVHRAQVSIYRSNGRQSGYAWQPPATMLRNGTSKPRISVIRA